MEYFKAFKTLLKSADDAGAFLQEVPYRRSVPFLTQKSIPETMASPGDREAIFVMTDSGVDREGDIIVSSGVDVAQFSEYGSILWGHKSGEPRYVLGRPAEVVKEETRILVRAEFFSDDINPDAARVFKMIQAGGLRAMSVGIMIREYSEASDRAGWYPLNILRSELIETSVTPVPVNPRAVELAVGGSDEERKATADLLTASTDDSEELGRTSEITNLDEDSIKSLVKQTVDLLLAKHVVYSVPAVDSAASALSFLARQAAQ